MTATGQSKYGSILISRTWACTVIYTYKLMLYYWRMFWKKIRDTCSKLTVIEIDLDYNQEMYAMIEAGLRGGMPQTTCKKVEANSKYMGDDYDSSKEISYINFYLDANKLFGLSMIQKLQYKNLEWDDKITEEDIIKNYKNGSMG